MIIEYNKYITQLLTENSSTSFTGLVDKIKSKFSTVRDTIIHHSITVDNQPVKIGQIYYAIFKVKELKEGEKPYYSVAKIKITSTVKDTKQHVFTFSIVEIMSPLQGKGKNDFVLVLPSNPLVKLNPKKTIIGFYLYEKEIPNKEIPVIIKRYGIVDDSKKSDVDSNQVEAGNVYELTKINGKTSTFGVYKKDDEKGQLNGYDFTSKKPYSILIKNIKSVTFEFNIQDYIIKEYLSKYKVSSIKKTQKYTKLKTNEERYKYLTNMRETIPGLVSNVKKGIEKTKSEQYNIFYDVSEFIEGKQIINYINKLDKNIDNSIKSLGEKIKSDKNTSEDDDSTLAQHDAAEKTANSLQAQNDVPSPLKPTESKKLKINDISPTPKRNFKSKYKRKVVNTKVKETEQKREESPHEVELVEKINNKKYNS